ncbi:hypothetical protein WA026_011996 [Henosepilachna vigintioctopunctata]|uniref:C2H2-type domain-containing protein n=1 Tax=Henosepilachna vigintioctopunctata TaxID=420089 RepID=A0AAW1V4M2_9CUCU
MGECLIGEDQIKIEQCDIREVKAEPYDYETAYEHSVDISDGLTTGLTCGQEYDDKLDVDEECFNYTKVQREERSEGSTDEEQSNIPKSSNRQVLDNVKLDNGMVKSLSTSISTKNFTAIEINYKNNCKNLMLMYHTRVCMCHNNNYSSIAELFNHLRVYNPWMPLHTCFHCMITFRNRSSYTKHMKNCRMDTLDRLTKLSNLKSRDQLKIRLYQNYQCVECQLIFSFHDDFRKHADENHIVHNPPYFCRCRQIFNSKERYRDHIYVSCMVKYFCDLCSLSLKSSNDFILHAEENHDNSEDVVENYKYSQNKRHIMKKNDNNDSQNLNSTESGVTVSSKMQRRYDDPQVCNICYLVCDDSLQLMNHKLSHGVFTGERQYVTPLPISKSTPNSKQYTVKRGLLDHNRTDYINDRPNKFRKRSNTKIVSKEDMLFKNSDSTKQFRFPCDICAKRFSTKRALKEHQQNHIAKEGIENKKLSTSSGIKFKSQDASLHKKESTEEVQTLTCYKTNEINISADFHVDQNLSLRNVSASFGVSYELQDELVQKLSAKKQRKTFICKLCPKNFKSQQAVNAHTGWHKRLTKGLLKAVKTIKPQSTPVKQDKTDFLCSHCHLELPNDTALKVHFLERHGNMAAYLTPRCETCNREFATISEYENHKNLHQIVENPKVFTEFKCSSCGIVFEKKISLLNHSRVHKRQKSFIGNPKPLFFCSICKIGFQTKKDLKAHNFAINH